MLPPTGNGMRIEVMANADFARLLAPQNVQICAAMIVERHGGFSRGGAWRVSFGRSEPSATVATVTVLSFGQRPFEAFSGSE